MSEPEIWFRIVHITLGDRAGASLADYRAQTVEIAIGSKQAFENRNAAR